MKNLSGKILLSSLVMGFVATSAIAIPPILPPPFQTESNVVVSAHVDKDGNIVNQEAPNCTVQLQVSSGIGIERIRGPISANEMIIA